MQMTEHDVPGPRRDVVGYGQHIPRVAWPDEARVAVNIVINYEEGSEVHMAADRRNETILGEMSLGLECYFPHYCRTISRFSTELSSYSSPSL